MGDSGESKEEGEGGVEEGDMEGDGKLIKESDSTYSIWASGRVHCEGFLAQIKVSNGLQCCLTLTILFPELVYHLAVQTAGPALSVAVPLQTSA